MVSTPHFVIVMIASTILLYLGSRLISAGLIKFNDPKKYGSQMKRDYELIAMGISLLILAVVLFSSLLV